MLGFFNMQGVRTEVFHHRNLSMSFVGCDRIYIPMPTFLFHQMESPTIQQLSEGVNGGKVFHHMDPPSWKAIPGLGYVVSKDHPSFRSDLGGPFNPRSWGRFGSP